MAYIPLSVQDVSFRGIYEIVNNVFTPKSLTWTPITSNDQFEFENRRGLTFLFVKCNNTHLFGYIAITTKIIIDNPFNLEVSEAIQMVYPNKANIFGPFSGAFNNNQSIIQIAFPDMDPGHPPFVDGSIAAIRLPRLGD